MRSHCCCCLFSSPSAVGFWLILATRRRQRRPEHIHFTMVTGRGTKKSASERNWTRSKILAAADFFFYLVISIVVSFTTETVQPICAPNSPFPLLLSRFLRYRSFLRCTETFSVRASVSLSRKKVAGQRSAGIGLTSKSWSPAPLSLTFSESPVHRRMGGNDDAVAALPPPLLLLLLLHPDWRP